MRVGVLTIAPSPHLAGTLVALGDQPAVELEVRCLTRTLPERRWEAAAQGIDWLPLIADGGVAGFIRRSEAVLLGTSYFRRETWQVVRAARAAQRAIAVLWEAPSSLSPSLVRLVRPFVLRALLARVDGLVGITPDTAEVYRRDYGFSGPTTWCPYHCDLARYRMVQPEPPRHAFRFVVLARLTAGKAVDVAIRALASVPEPAQLLVIGHGPERGRLGHLAAQVAPRRVRFLGNVPYADVPSVLCEAHALVMPSLYDGFGMAVIEALAAGLPVIASDAVASARLLLRPGVTGWLAPAGDVEAFAVRMRELLTKRHDWQLLSGAARASLSDYDPRRDAQRLATFMSSLCKC